MQPGFIQASEIFTAELDNVAVRTQNWRIFVSDGMKARPEDAEKLLNIWRARWPDDELTRVSMAVDVLSGKMPASVHPYQQAKGIYLPGLSYKPWLNPFEFPFVKLLQANYPAIREEVRQLMDGRLNAPPYGLANDAAPDAAPKPGNPAGWYEWRLYRAGEFCEDRCAYFPCTRSTIAQILEHSPFMMNAIFLILEPGECLAPHCDSSNVFVNIWLPLEVPDGCSLTVAGVTLQPKSGELLAFNHSYLHSADNRGSTKRIVLALSVFNPELTSAECEVLKSLRSSL
jgi:aspartyl/asparaginyl beta-hydroxylase (cupin superfamily)